MWQCVRAIPTLVELKPEYFYTYKASMGFILNARSPGLQRKPCLERKEREKKEPNYQPVNMNNFVKVLPYLLRS